MVGAGRAMLMMVAEMWALTVVMAMSAESAAGYTVCPDANSSDPSIDEMVYYSDLVVHGTVLKQYPDPGAPEGYTAEMKVHCVFKGDNVPQRINITKAGNVSEACFATNFEAGTGYVAYLRRTNDGVLTPMYPQNPEGYTEEIYIICDLKVTYPMGVTNVTADVPCEDPAAGSDYGDYGEENCAQPFVPPTEPPKKPVTPEKPKKTEDDSENGSGSLRMSFIVLAFLCSVLSVFS